MNTLGKMICVAFSASAFLSAGVANAEVSRDAYSVSFHYKSDRTAAENYRSFKRAAKQTCETQGRRPAEVVRLERACTADIMDKAVAAVNRTELALLHDKATGRPAAAPRTFASIAE